MTNANERMTNVNPPYSYAYVTSFLLRLKRKNNGNGSIETHWKAGCQDGGTIISSSQSASNECYGQHSLHQPTETTDKESNEYHDIGDNHSYGMLNEKEAAAPNTQDAADDYSYVTVGVRKDTAATSDDMEYALAGKISETEECQMIENVLYTKNSE